MIKSYSGARSGVINQFRENNSTFAHYQVGWMDERRLKIWAIGEVMQSLPENWDLA